MIHAVAIKYKGTLYTLPQPARHYELMPIICEDTGANVIFGQGEQGFITDTGEFLGRVEAGKHALACGQCKMIASASGELYSEEVW